MEEKKNHDQEEGRIGKETQTTEELFPSMVVNSIMG
jgi:hypothetical protein